MIYFLNLLRGFGDADYPELFIPKYLATASPSALKAEVFPLSSAHFSTQQPPFPRYRWPFCPSG